MFFIGQNLNYVHMTYYFLKFLIFLPLGGSKVDSAFHPSKVDKMSTRNIWGFSGKK